MKQFSLPSYFAACESWLFTSAADYQMFEQMRSQETQRESLPGVTTALICTHDRQIQNAKPKIYQSQ